MSSPYPPPGEYPNQHGDSYLPQSSPGNPTPGNPTPGGKGPGGQGLGGQQGFPPPQPGYGPPAYGAAPGGPGGPTGPGGPMGPGGPGAPWGGQPPAKSKTPWIIGGAVVLVVALVATILIVTLGGDDDDTETAGGDGGEDGGSGGSSLTCEDGDYGIKIDPESGESIECNGTASGGDDESGGDAGSGGPGSGEDAEVEAIEGTWTVTTMITYIDGDLNDGATGAPLTEGDSTWSEGSHEWMIQPPYCSAGTSCSASVLDTTTDDSITLDSDGESWIGYSAIDIQCADGSSDPMDITIEIPLADASELSGTMETSSASVCGAEAITIEEEITLTK